MAGDPQGVLIRAAEPLNHHTIPVISQHDERKNIIIILTDLANYAER